jgi:hypothetical protein
MSSDFSASSDSSTDSSFGEATGESSAEVVASEPEEEQKELPKEKIEKKRRRRPRPVAPPPPPPPVTEVKGHLSQDGETGYLVYMFTGDQEAVEMAVLRKICMKHGLQAWDHMLEYIPWRNRAAFRTTLCRIIRRQALSEYDGIKADPFEIQKDNPLDIDSVVKGGMLINQEWERGADDWEAVRTENEMKYGMSAQDIENVEIPTVISIDYIKHVVENRRQSLLLKRAAILHEISKRKNEECCDLGVEELLMAGDKALELRPIGKVLEMRINAKEGFHVVGDDAVAEEPVNDKNE